MSQDHNQGSSHFSKRPAAAGGGRSFSSRHQSAAGTPPEDSSFVKAIFSKITFEAHSQRIPVDPANVRDFARRHAVENPPKNPPRGMQFGQEHVDAAFEQFKDQYEPPQPSPQRPPQPSPQPAQRLSARDQLISDLTKHGIEALPPHLQEKFRKVRKVEGLCFFIQHLDVEALQRSVCESSGLGVLLGFFDIFMSQEGLMLSFFAQKRFNGRPVQFRPASANSILLVCVRCFGSPRPVETQQLFLSDLDVVVRDSTSGYNKAGQVVSLVQQVSSANQDMHDDQRDSSQCLFVPQDEEDFLRSSISHDCDESSRQICKEVMKRAGAIPIPFSSSSSATAATAATEVLAPSAPNAEDDIIFCQHNNTIKNGEIYTPCTLCLEGPPRRGKICDGWGKTVGYRN
jgi:hypothetical protein